MVLLEHAEGRRIGQHQARRARAHHRLQRGEIDIAVAVGRNLLHRIAAHHRRRRIGAVGGVGHDDLAARGVAARLVIGADHGHPGELPLGPGHRRERHPRHAGDILEDLLQFVQAGEEALSARLRRQGVAGEERGQHGETVARPRVVLHGAGAERIEMGVDGEVPLRQPGVVAHGIEFRHLGQVRRGRAQQFGRDVVRVRSLRRCLVPAAAAGLRQFEYQHLGSSFSLPGRAHCAVVRQSCSAA